MKTEDSEALAGWPDAARQNTRISERSDRSTDPSLHVLVMNWLRALFGR